jgi:hypothetical protein
MSSSTSELTKARAAPQPRGLSLYGENVKCAYKTGTAAKLLNAIGAREVLISRCLYDFHIFLSRDSSRLAMGIW